MTLKQLRARWEDNGEVKLCVVHSNEAVYSIIYLYEEYYLHRYVMVGGTWRCSNDIRSQSIDNCLGEINKVFHGLLPKERS